MKQTLMVLVLAWSGFACAHTSIYDVKNQAYVEQSDFYKSVPRQAQVVLGEYHYNPAIQKLEGRIISKYVKATQSENAFTLGWEFMNYPDQEKIAKGFEEYKKGSIDFANFIKIPFPNNSETNMVYMPMFRITAKLGGDVVATNAPRKWKSVITAGGLSSMSPERIPPNFELGGDNYFERFKVVMGNHVPANKIKNYFEAQSYTDNVISWAMLNYSKEELNFLVIGSFHSDYNDGVVPLMKKKFSYPTLNLKLVDESKMTEEELKEMLAGHPKYGALADYIFIIGH